MHKGSELDLSKPGFQQVLAIRQQCSPGPVLKLSASLCPLYHRGSRLHELIRVKREMRGGPDGRVGSKTRNGGKRISYLQRSVIYMLCCFNPQSFIEFFLYARYLSSDPPTNPCLLLSLTNGTSETLRSLDQFFRRGN